MDILYMSHDAVNALERAARENLLSAEGVLRDRFRFSPEMVERAAKGAQEARQQLMDVGWWRSLP